VHVHLFWHVEPMRLVLMVHNCLHHKASRYLMDYCIVFAGPAAWNSLSDDLRDPMLSTDSFRHLLKTRLFSEY